MRLISVGGVQDENAFGGRRCEVLAEVLLKHSFTAVASFTFREIFWNHKALNRKYKGLAKPF
jgi:hypothetical protein